MAQEGFRSNMTCPLIGKDSVLGFIFFSSFNKNTYTLDHASILAAMHKTLSQTLEKCRLYEELTLRNKFIRNVFGRYISDDIADELLIKSEALKMGGRACKVTILMSDIRGFTKMSEHMKPEDVVTILNTYFNEMVKVIHHHNGTIDNIIGDAIMVLFGAPISRLDDAKRAIACAVDMQAAMVDVNKMITYLGLPQISMGIGINTGDVVAGNIGSEAHTKYSVIGAPVNLAARLESKALPGEILLSHDTYQASGCTAQIAEVRNVTAKGFTDPVKSYVIRAEP
jgi:adenylate cyclase